MTGLSGLELTSADGAQLRLTPQAASRRPSSRATARVSSDVVHRAERVVAGEGGAGAHLQAGDVAALLVDRDQHVVPLGAQLRGERGQLAGRGDVAAEQADGGEPLAEPAQQPVGGGGAGEAGLEDGRGRRG